MNQKTISHIVTAIHTLAIVFNIAMAFKAFAIGAYDLMCSAISAALYAAGAVMYSRATV
jgi:hypothetical protein